MSAALASDPARRSRKSAEDRIADLIDVADDVVCQTRSAELSLQQVADAIGISRALVYAYFPDRFRLLDAVLARHVDWLRGAGLETAAGAGSFQNRAAACARIALDHILEHGPALELILRERDVARQLDGDALRFLRRVLARLARCAADELELDGAEALAMVEILSVIPIEAAARVRADDVPAQTAHAVCARMMAACIEAQVPQHAPNARTAKD